MRDKNRIRPFMEELIIFWEAHPDLRFGQVIYMLAEKLDVSDIFFPEEEQWSKALSEIKTVYWNGFQKD